MPRSATAPAAAGGLIDSLAGIEGFEPAAGLALTDDEDAFLRRLQQFIATHEDGVPGLDSSLSTGQRERALRLVHTLKGSSAAIGARMLQQLASSCELAIAQDAPMERQRLLAFDIEYELVHLIGSLHDRLPALAAAAPEEERRDNDLNPAQLDAAVDSLGVLLAAGDFGAERLHREIAADLRKAFGETAGKLAQAIRNHDHERAIALIEILKAGPRPAATEKDL
jgi:HPt (histidine-containing phosphotransfer) domain-containing protein